MSIEIGKNFKKKKIKILASNSSKRDRWLKKITKDIEFYNANKNNTRKLNKLKNAILDKKFDKYQTALNTKKVNHNFAQSYEKDIKNFKLNSNCLQQQYKIYHNLSLKLLRRDPLYKNFTRVVQKYKNRITKHWLAIALAILAKEQQ